MKYTYIYKSSDGVRHEGAIEAPSREVVFESLRKKGIRAIKVVASDGSKANGEIVVRGVRKRVFAVSALGLVLCAVLAAVLAFRAGESLSDSQAANLSVHGTSSPRHQIYGDPVIVEDLERGCFENILLRPGDCYLAWFAQPGKLMCPKGVSLQDLRKISPAIVEDLERTLDDHIPLADAEPREIRELKQIVNGIRDELREYLANGNGTVRSFGRRLYERTQQEAQIYERTREELKNEKNLGVWKAKNDALRTLGLRTIPNPNEQ